MSKRLLIIPEEAYEAQKRDVLMDSVDKSLLKTSDDMTNVLHNPSLSNDAKYLLYDQTLKKQNQSLDDKNEKLEKMSINAMNPDIIQKIVDQLSDVMAKLNLSNAATSPTLSTASTPPFITPETHKPPESLKLSDTDALKKQNTARRLVLKEKREREMDSAKNAVLQYMWNNPSKYTFNKMDSF